MADAAIFISYRRSDALHAAIAVADALRRAFGEDQVFLDLRSIDYGERWPDRLTQQVAAARLTIAVIGRDWLRTCDEYGRRRIDDPLDWVRCELVGALDAAPPKLLLPVLVQGAQPLSRKGLDASLGRLADHQALTLHDEQWDSGLQLLVQRVGSLLAMLPAAPGRSDEPYADGAPKPSAHKRHTPTFQAADQALDDWLAQHPGWHAEWSQHAWGRHGRAFELRRRYAFESFELAMAFMAHVADAVAQDAALHHPRWQNQWRTVTVWFSTWDAGCRISQFDLGAAEAMDRWHRDFLAQRG